MNYRTRHLEAVTDCPMGGAYYTAGQKFEASEVDAEYLVRTSRAKEVIAPAVAAPAPTPPRRGRPPGVKKDTESESTDGTVEPIKFADTPTGAADTTSDA